MQYLPIIILFVGLFWLFVAFAQFNRPGSDPDKFVNVGMHFTVALIICIISAIAKYVIR